MLVGMDIAARTVCPRNEMSAPRMRLEARYTLSISACDFLQTPSFLKSPMLQSALTMRPRLHRISARIVIIAQTCCGAHRKVLRQYDPHLASVGFGISDLFCCFSVF